jgi:hypothetical protein
MWVVRKGSTTVTCRHLTRGAGILPKPCLAIPSNGLFTASWMNSIGSICEATPQRFEDAFRGATEVESRRVCAGRCLCGSNWCREGDLNPHGNPIRPSSVRVCQFRHPGTM